jgi:hypothetical protein
VNRPSQRSRRAPLPPSGFEGYLSRRDAAAELGLASEFKVRQLEKEGHLHPVRGVMGSAWYPRAEVLAARAVLAPRSVPARTAGRWSDGELIALLREPIAGRLRTVADLVVEAGVSIARAERVYRFWLHKDAHPLATRARGGNTIPLPADEEPAATAERRGAERLRRDGLIRQMRDPDPKVRAAAFTRLKQTL